MKRVIIVFKILLFLNLLLGCNLNSASTIPKYAKMDQINDSGAPRQPTLATAHPRAKDLMNTDWYYSPIEEMAPFGNDDGAETFWAYSEWRNVNEKTSPVEFINQQLDYWGYRRFDLTMTNSATIIDFIKASPTGARAMYGTDAAIFAVAFGELYIVGTIHPEMKKLAQTAIDRQLLPVLLTSWDQFKGDREKRLKDFRRILIAL